MRTLCKIEGCQKVCWGRGLCSMHYQRWRSKGDPTIEPAHPKTGGRPRLAERCSVDGCEREGPYVRALCKLHYTRWDAHGDPLWEPPPRATCSVEGCERIWHVKGLCVMHYGRLREHGDVGEATPRRKAAGEGNVDELGYHRVTVNGKKRKGHRYVMEQKLGRALLPEETVHHINGNRSDNRPENLELWVGNHGRGQRVEDLVSYLVEYYRDEVLKAL